MRLPHPLLAACLAGMLQLCVGFGEVISDVYTTTKFGRLRGNRVKRDLNLGPDAVTMTIDRYLGVPYAKPPTGSRRFKNPEQMETWGDAVLDATQFGLSCPQMIYSGDTRLHRQDEDCLFLDIYSPHTEEQGARRFPVMVYIHGGSYEVGAGRSVDGSVLAHLGVVVVTINYRLGALGFLTANDQYLTGNYGIMDQVEALKWVNENIHVFGGDRSKVTIFGHSVGAASVGLLMVIPQAKGLFHGVIAQSGVATAPYSVHNPADGVINFADYMASVGRLFGCTNYKRTDGLVNCLRGVSWHDMIERRHEFPLFHPINPEFRPIVDGHVVTDLPSRLFERGEFQRVPLIIGTVRDEFGNYFGGGERYRSEFDEALDNYLLSYIRNDHSLFDVIKFQYSNMSDKSGVYDYQRGDVLSDMHMIAPTIDMANIISTHTNDIYQYHFSTEGKSYHSVDLNYVFGAPFSGQFSDEMTVNGSVDMFTTIEKQLSLEMMLLWTNFAKTGRPTMPSRQHVGANRQTAQRVINVTWRHYTESEGEYLLLSAQNTTMDGRLRANFAAFWNKLVPSVMSRGARCASANEQKAGTSTVIGMWSLLALTVLLLALVAVLTVLLVRREIVARQRRRCPLTSSSSNSDKPPLTA